MDEGRSKIMDARKKMKKSKWEDKLIVAVSHRPVVYDKGLVDYKNKNIVGRAWEEIAEAVGETAVECKRRWKTLCDGYRKHLEREEDSKKSGSGQCQGKVWEFAAVMSFMKPHMAKRDTSGNMGKATAPTQGPRKRPAATHTSTTKESAGTSSRNTFITLVPMAPADQGDEDSLPLPPPTLDSSTLFDIPELQTLDNPDVQQCVGDEQEQEEEEEDVYVPVARKVRRHQANPQHQDMTRFQEALVNEMALTHTAPQNINGHFFLSMAKMVDGLPVRGQHLLRLKMLQIYNDMYEQYEVGEQAP